MSDSHELPDCETPATSTEDRLGRFLEEAMKLEQRGEVIDVAAMLTDRPDLIDRGRRLVQGVQSFRAAVTTGFAPARPTHEASLPDPFPGEFRIRGAVGEGTFGKVWLADDLQLGRAGGAEDVASPRRCRRIRVSGLRKEANILANLDHRNVVKVHAWRQAGGEHYLVLEYVAGGSLADLLKQEGPLPWQRAARYIANVSEGLLEVHAQGIIHRDIKASNTLWEPGRDEAKLTDFGVAGRLGATRTAVGTPVFMAPEALRGRATEASDVYGLAATLFHLTTGELPFAATTADELATGAARGLSSRRPFPAGSPAAGGHHPRRPGGKPSGPPIAASLHRSAMGRVELRRWWTGFFPMPSRGRQRPRWDCGWRSAGGRQTAGAQWRPRSRRPTP